LSKRILSEAGRIAEGTAIISKIKDDYSIISEHAKDAQEFEKYVEYNDTIGKDKLVIAKDLIVFKKRRFWINEISGIRYGIYQESVNGVPTSRSYAIWLKCGNPNNPEKTFPSDYIPPVTPSENVMMIECADATWFGVDKIQTRFNEIVNRLYHLVQVPMVNKMIQDFESGRRVYVSSIIIDFTGIYKDFNYNPLSKGVISLSSKYLGTKDVAAKEGKHKHISWDNYRGYNLSQGRIHLFDDRGSWISFSLRDDWNAANLPYFFDFMNKDENLGKSIEKCISGVTAVQDEQSEVIKTLDNSLEIDPKNWLTWWQKGRALKNLGRFEEAIASFDQVIALNPKNPEVWNLKGLIFLEINKNTEALDCFERGLAIDPQLSHIWYNKGMTLERLKKYDESVRALDRSLAIKFDQEVKHTRDNIHSLQNESVILSADDEKIPQNSNNEPLTSTSKGSNNKPDKSGGEGLGDIFDFFGGGKQQRSAPQPGADLLMRIQVRPEDVVSGTNRDIEVMHTEYCPACNGTGNQSKRPSTCPNCAGTGQIRRVSPSPFGQFVRMTPCTQCEGQGKTTEVVCKECRGTGHIRIKRNVSLHIPAGIKDGMRLRMEGWGECGDYGQKTGDLFIEVHLKS
jgi:tetratricopeptide (TPR) repeat protein